MKNDISRNILLIALAVRLQRLVKNLPNHHVSAERISKRSLAESYLSDGLSVSEEAARKKAGRYIDEIKNIFNLSGSEKSGYMMDHRFSSFKDMFVFWLEQTNPPSPADKRLHVMLQGLIHAIDNAFTEDPIIISELAKQLKAKYANKNIRDTREPLMELFDNTYVASWLQLIELDEQTLGIDVSMDPLLLRLKPRSEVSDNQDISIKLARPGRIHVVFEHTISDLDSISKSKCQYIAKAVQQSEVWCINTQDYLPYILYREGQRGQILLTLRNLTLNQFEDFPMEEIEETPVAIRYFTPFDIDANSWANIQQMVV